jgi:heat shock protein HslJ
MVVRLLAVCAAVALVMVGGSWVFGPGDHFRGTGSPWDVDWAGTWLLDSGTYDGQPLALMNTRPITLVIEGDVASGRSSCNWYGLTAERRGDGIAITEIRSTLMGCEPAVLRLEDTYLQAIHAVTDVNQQGDTLTLASEHGQLVFHPLPPLQIAALVDTTWVLDSMTFGGTASPVLGKSTLRLDSDGSVAGSTGCRRFFGKWSESGGQLEFNPLRTSEVTCANRWHRQDATVLTMGDGFDAHVDGGKLSISLRDGSTLGYHVRT